ncbi:MAG: hypothetical protein JXA54_11320 [Candidatus Heimdallarchaeota archaeon]|nr:hypothetical protein [Candidatus Heimdallarchaeota archaeon]
MKKQQIKAGYLTGIDYVAMASATIAMNILYDIVISPTAIIIKRKIFDIKRRKRKR